MRVVRCRLVQELQAKLQRATVLLEEGKLRLALAPSEKVPVKFSDAQLAVYCSHLEKYPPPPPPELQGETDPGPQDPQAGRGPHP